MMFRQAAANMGLYRRVVKVPMLENAYCVPPGRILMALASTFTGKNQYNHSSIYNVDTLRLRKRLESQGLTPKAAEVLATSMKEIINSCLETASASFAFKVEREKANLVFDAKFVQLKEELEKSRRLKVMANQHEIEKIISFGVEKVRSELSHELSKEAASMWLLISKTKRDALNYAIGGTFLLSGSILVLFRMMS